MDDVNIVTEAYNIEYLFCKQVIIPPETKFRGVYWIHPVRPSVRPSVGRCPDDNSFQWI